MDSPLSTTAINRDYKRPFEERQYNHPGENGGGKGDISKQLYEILKY